MPIVRIYNGRLSHNAAQLNCALAMMRNYPFNLIALSIVYITWHLLELTESPKAKTANDTVRVLCEKRFVKNTYQIDYIFQYIEHSVFCAA